MMTDDLHPPWWRPDRTMKMLTSLSSPLLSWPHRLLLLLLLLLQCGGCFRQNNVGGVVWAQEAPNPLLQLEPFASTTSFRQDFCSRSANLSTMNGDIGGILQGVELHTAMELGEFIKFDHHGRHDDEDIRHLNLTLNADYPGLLPRLMDELCLRTGCSWRNTYTILGALPPNRTYSELLTWSTDAYDISLDWWMRSSERMRNGVAFTEPWFDASIIMVTKQKDPNNERFNAVSWLSPFDNYVWLMIVATILVSAVIYWCLEVLNPDSDQRNQDQKLDAIESVWLLATAFAGQFEFDPQTAPARVFTFSIAFWALLMGAAYTANLASFLVIKNKPRQLAIESIEQAVRMNIPMCVYEATLTHQTIQQRFPAYAQSGLLIPTTLRGVYEGIGDTCQIGITEVSTWKGIQYDKAVNGDCSLYWVGRAFDFVPASFAVKADSGDKCSSLVKTVFDVHLHDMIKEGKLEELWDEHLQATATVFCQAGGGGGGSSSAGGDAERCRRGRFLKEDDYDVLLRPEDGDPANNGHYRRHLIAAQNDEGGGGNKDLDTTQLTLQNMGGVFLLHGILSGLSLIWAFISWSRKRHANAAAGRKESNGTGGGIEQAMILDAASSIDHDEFFDASTSAEEFRQKMTTRPVEKGSGVDELRMEIKQLESIEKKMAALLGKKEQ